MSRGGVGCLAGVWFYAYMTSLQGTGDLPGFVPEPCVGGFAWEWGPVSAASCGNRCQRDW